MGLFDLMDEQPHFLHLWDRLASRTAVKEFLLSTFHLFNELVTKDIYPQEWATMKIVANAVLIKTMEVNILANIRVCQQFPLNLLTGFGQAPNDPFP